MALMCATVCGLTPAWGGEILWLGQFEAADSAIPPPWRTVQLDSQVAATQYQRRVWDGVAAVEAFANKSMTLLARPVTADLAKTPVLCWRWRIDSVLHNADMASKHGDDYAARVYVAFRLPPEALGWITRTRLALARKLYGDVLPDAAINYVWDNRYPIGTQRPNAFTDRSQMYVLQSGNDHAGKWMTERRDLAADFQQLFGHSQGQLISLALAVDTDNTGELAHAGFADIHLVNRDMPCRKH
jgi:hypothetical protein